MFNLGDKIFIPAEIVGVEKTSDGNDVVYSVVVKTTSYYGNDGNERFSVSKGSLYTLCKPCDLE